MDLPIEYDRITRMFEQAEAQNRNFLFEYEVYTLLASSGAETPPKNVLIPRGSRPSDEALTTLPGAKTVLKIVSPYIIHKTEAGGVRIVENQASKVRSAVRRMFYEVPENFAAQIERHSAHAPEPYRGLGGEALVSAISRDIQGFSRSSSCRRIPMHSATS